MLGNDIICSLNTYKSSGTFMDRPVCEKFDYLSFHNNCYSYAVVINVVTFRPQQYFINDK